MMPAALSGKGSFSYNIVGGAFFNGDGTSSVNPDAVVQLATLSPSVTGNVSIDGHTSYINPFTDPSIPSGGSSRVNVTIDVPTMVRTGTDSPVGSERTWTMPRTRSPTKSTSLLASRDTA